MKLRLKQDKIPLKIRNKRPKIKMINKKSDLKFKMNF